jgi:hypothetical protein
VDERNSLDEAVRLLGKIRGSLNSVNTSLAIIAVLLLLILIFK